MSRSKRVRKARMKARQMQRLDAQIKSAGAFFTEQRERMRFRKELNASDIPDAVKTLVGVLVDPVGFVHDRLREERDIQ